MPSDPSPVSLRGEVVAGVRESGRKVHVEEVDVVSENSIVEMRDRVLAADGRIDGSVYNAVTRPMRSNDDPISAWEKLIVRPQSSR